ncbi:DHHC palmitoyltransferase-domain-containing protein [Zopfochytrium polystomum]|nr:DHHC palmitoyltransferase-domain-containing protein [Zopfochytrium polystomum]
MSIPLFIYSHEQFFSSAFFDPRQFNAWWRRDGFQRPLHAYTLGYAATVVFLAGGFFGFLQMFIFPLSLRLVVLVVAGSMCLFQVASSVVTMTIDPQDRTVVRARVPRNVNYVKRPGVPVIDPETRLCGICQVHVDARTRHCKPCNKCVERFDHHCPYLSTCVGKSNYWSFFSTLVLGFTLCSFVTAMAARVIVLFFMDRSTFDSVVVWMFGSGDRKAQTVVAFVFVYAVFGVLVCLATVSLLILHIRLGLCTSPSASHPICFL